MQQTKTFRTIETVKCSIYCHASATRAYVASKCLMHQVRLQQPSHDFLSMLRSIEPIHVIQENPNTYLFFSGWHWLECATVEQNKEIEVIVHSRISKKRIATFSWTYVINKLLCDLDRSSGLSQLVDVIEQMPLEVRKSFFKKNHSHSAVQTAMRLTNESRAAVRNQIQRKRSKPTSRDSIINQLLQDD